MASRQQHQQDRDNGLHVGRDGHLHWNDPEREAFTRSVDAFGDALEAKYLELSEVLEVAQDLA